MKARPATRATMMFGLALAMVIPGIALTSAPSAATTTTLYANGASAGRAFDGFGALSAGATSRLLYDYSEPYRGQILDYLFKPGYGANLQILKVEIGGNVNSTDGSEPSHLNTRAEMGNSLDGSDCHYRGYEWWLMREAKVRNPNIKLAALQWGTPGWVGDHNRPSNYPAYIDPGVTNDYVNIQAEFSDDNVDYLKKFLSCAQTQGTTIDYIGGALNEAPESDPKYTKGLSYELKAHWPNLKIIAADQLRLASHGAGTSGVVNQINADSAYAAAVDVVGYHYPADAEGAEGTTPNVNAQATGKPLWASEDAVFETVYADRFNWKGAMDLARLTNENYVKRRVSGQIHYSLVSGYYEGLAYPGAGLVYANQPWANHYEVNPQLWVTAHTTQFVNPGWRYVDTASRNLTGGGSVVTFKNCSTSCSNADWTTVVETSGASAAQTIDLQVQGGLKATTTLRAWRSQNGSYLQRRTADDRTPVSGNVSLTVQPDSVYTFTTSSRTISPGSATGSSFAVFPFPYVDTFESYSLGNMAKYFSDQHGSFEVGCGSPQSKCLKQIDTAPAHGWGGFGRTQQYSMIGDPAWTNVEARAGLSVASGGSVALWGRVQPFSSAGLGSASEQGRYQVTLFNMGNNTWSWRLQTVLLGGVVDSNPAKSASGSGVPFKYSGVPWANVMLRMNGSTITLYIDDYATPKATITDSQLPYGSIAVGSGYNEAYFDNVCVQQIGGTTCPT